MKQIDINIYEVKTYIYGLIKGVISNNVFLSMPKNINAAWDEFISIEMPQMSSNKDAYGNVTVWVVVYAKDMDNGLVDSYKLNEIQKQIDNIFNGITEDNNKFIIQKWESMEVQNPQLPNFSGIMVETKITVI